MKINQIVVKKINDFDFNEAMNLILEVMNDFDQLPLNMQKYEDAKYYFKAFTYDDYQNNELELYGAFYNDKIIGVLGNDKNYLNYFFVKKDFQNKKVGTLLMKDFLNRMQDQQYKEIYVDASNYAHEIYKKIGFEDAYEHQKKRKEYEMIYRMENYNGIQ